MSQGTETRKRTKLVGFRVLPDDHDRVRQFAEEQGMNISEFLLDLIDRGAPGLIRGGGHAGS
jgi:hypothetical protein